MRRILWPQEVRNRIPILVGCDRDDAVQAAAEEFAAEEPQRIADVDNCMPISRCDELPFCGTRPLKLQSPLLGEEQSYGSYVGVLVVAHSIVQTLLGVVEKYKRCVGRLVVPMMLLETSTAI